MTSNPSADLGRVTCSLRGSVVAGSYQTCALTYTAGFAGVDDTGSLKFVMRYATDSGTPQFDDPAEPNFTTAAASNGAKLELRYDVKDNVRPWDKTIYLKIVQGYLRKGDRLTLTLGDRTHGSPGWRMPTFLEETFEIRVLVDRYATYVYEQVPQSPVFRVIAGEPVRLVAVAPSLVEPGERIVVRTKLEDAWGNPVGKPRRFTHAGFAEPGAYRIPVTDEANGLRAETNPILIRSGERYARFWADLHGQSEETIGTNSIEAYFRFARDFGFLDLCAHQGNDFQITDAFWKTIQETTRQFNEPGRFVTFPGWEWSGNTALGGDRNVLFREEGGPISRSSRALVSETEAVDPCSHTVEELFARLEAWEQNTQAEEQKMEAADQKLPSPSGRGAGGEGSRAVMLVPHVGGRYADLERHHEGLEPVVEVHSAWGTFEWMLDDAFRRGYRIGIVANSDGHKGRPGASYPGASTFGSYGGLTCVLAERLDRQSVWEAYQSRRMYATTGARIGLNITADGGLLMGSVREVGKHSLPEFHVRVFGTAAIERIEFRNAMRVLQTLRPYTAADLGSRVKVLWQGATVRGRGRQVVWDGGLKVSRNQIRGFETINFHNLEKACRQVGRTELEWQSLTTGGVAGVILELEKPTAGELAVRTAQHEFRVPVAELDLEGRTYELGGVGKKVSAYRLPSAGGCRELEFRFRPTSKDLQRGDNPLYVCVVQEDGHMAWSSPIYLVKV